MNLDQAPIGSVVTFTGGAAHHQYDNSGPQSRQVWASTSGQVYASASDLLQAHPDATLVDATSGPILSTVLGKALAVNARWEDHVSTHYEGCSFSHAGVSGERDRGLHHRRHPGGCTDAGGGAAGGRVGAVLR